MECAPYGSVMNINGLKTNWKAIKPKLKEVYVDLSDEDLHYEEGRESELIGRIQRKTRQSQGQVEQQLDDMIFKITAAPTV